MDPRDMTTQRLDLELAGFLVVSDIAWELKNRLQQHRGLFQRQGALNAGDAAARIVEAVDDALGDYWKPEMDDLRAELDKRTEAA